MYKVIVGQQKYNGLEELEKKVKKAIRQGWKTQGGICVVMNYDQWMYYYQAMVKAK